MDYTKKCFDLLPKYQEIKTILDKCPTANWIIPKAIDFLKNAEVSSAAANTCDVEEIGILLQALQDKLWECIHTGHFSQIPMEIRQIFCITCLIKICLLLLSLKNVDIQKIEKCSQTLDEALLLGYPEHIYKNCHKLKADLMEFLDKQLNNHFKGSKLPVIHPAKRITKAPCDVQQLDQPSIEMFKKCCFTVQQPALLFNTFNEWPALRLWHDLNYILELAGNRLVPIEIGNNYSSENWSQQLMKLREFLVRQFQSNGEKLQQQQRQQQKSKEREQDSSESRIEYLAQHDLFEQIPLLKNDFSIPDYCCLGKSENQVEIKAWLGPKGTISPLHHDPKHNFLCQIFGTKKIILASPDDSPNLYPNLNEFLQNTSQVDAEELDYECYPLVANVKFYHLTLQRGDCLYIPAKWWHYVKSLSSSFSISFWWD